MLDTETLSLADHFNLLVSEGYLYETELPYVHKRIPAVERLELATAQDEEPKTDEQIVEAYCFAMETIQHLDPFIAKATTLSDSAPNPRDMSQQELDALLLAANTACDLKQQRDHLQKMVDEIQNTYSSTLNRRLN